METFELRFLVAVIDNFQGLWVPAFRLRRADPNRSDEQVAVIAEAVLRDLLHRDLIYLFRCDREVDLQDAINDPSARLSAKEAETEIASGWWRERLPSRAHIWIAATDEGERVALTFETTTADER